MSNMRLLNIKRFYLNVIYISLILRKAARDTLEIKSSLFQIFDTNNNTETWFIASILTFRWHSSIVLASQTYPLK